MVPDYLGTLGLENLGQPILTGGPGPEVGIRGLLRAVAHYVTDDGQRRTRLVVESFNGQRVSVLDFVEGDPTRPVDPASSRH